jgi:protein TonB
VESSQKAASQCGFFLLIFCARVGRVGGPGVFTDIGYRYREDAMFADSLCDSRSDHDSRRWTTLLSFAVQAVAVAVLLTLPFLSPPGLPGISLISHLLVPRSQAATQVRPQQAPRFGPVSSHTLLVPPDHILHGIRKTDDADPEPVNLFLGDAASISARIGDPVGVAASVGATLPVLKPVPVVRPVRVSVMMEGNLTHRVQPQYPAIAKLARIQGSVLLRAVISREGMIENSQAVGGPPALVTAAMDAVRQWRYRPYVLNGEAVEVDTQVTVNFVLGGG